MLKSKKIVFIDDSGDPGFKFGRGSTKYFAIALVVFDDDIDAEETSVIIKKFRRSLGWASHREFKFHQLRSDICCDFLRAVMKGNFTIRAMLLDKTKIADNQAIQGKTNFYHFAIKEVLAHNPDINNAHIHLDGKAENEYKRAVRTYFRQHLNVTKKTVEKFKFVDSKTDNLIQLADMVAGAIRRTTETDKSDHDRYYKIIKSKIVDLWKND